MPSMSAGSSPMRWARRLPFDDRADQIGMAVGRADAGLAGIGADEHQRGHPRRHPPAGIEEAAAGRVLEAEVDDFDVVDPHGWTSLDDVIRSTTIVFGRAATRSVPKEAPIPPRNGRCRTVPQPHPPRFARFALPVPVRDWRP